LMSGRSGGSTIDRAEYALEFPGVPGPLEESSDRVRVSYGRGGTDPGRGDGLKDLQLLQTSSSEIQLSRACAYAAMASRMYPARPSAIRS
jgi:hypothetical protein